MKKNAIYLTFSVIFLALSALGIGWLVRQEIEKGKQENQKTTISKRKSFPEGESQNSASEQKMVIQNKEDANKALDDVENLMNSTEQEEYLEE